MKLKEQFKVKVTNIGAVVIMIWLRIVREKNRISNVPSALGISPHCSPAGIFCQLYSIFWIQHFVNFTLYFQSDILSIISYIFYPISYILWLKFCREICAWYLICCTLKISGYCIWNLYYVFLVFLFVVCILYSVFCL